MEENNTKKESTIDDVLFAISKSSGETQKQIDDLKKDLGGRITALELQVSDINSTLNKMGDDIKKVKAGVEKTADILEQKEIINVAERQQIFHAADPFALPA